MKRQLILLLTLCHSTLLIYSQNTTNSPTSMFGLGELSTGEVFDLKVICLLLLCDSPCTL